MLRRAWSLFSPSGVGPAVSDDRVNPDPSAEHEAAASSVLVQLATGLDSLGLQAQYVSCGATTFDFVPGEQKEADVSLLAAPNMSKKGPPTLACEIAYTQSKASMKRNIMKWVEPRPAGGGARVAIGLDMKKLVKGWRIEAYVATWHGNHASVKGPVTLGPVRPGRAAPTGDARYFVWIPLALMLPGLGGRSLMWCSLMIALHGLCQGVRAFKSHFGSAVLSAIARCAAPWKALPVDLGQVLTQVLKLA